MDNNIHLLSEKWSWGSTSHFIYNTLGLCSVEFFNTTHWGYIYGLIVDLEHRRKGIGTELIKYCEDYIRDCGYDEVRLDVEKGRRFQYEWYKRLGYEVYYEDEELYYMKKKLS